MSRRHAAILALALGLPGCASELAADAARDVLTLRQGTMSGLKRLRGTGPFREFAVPPAEMLEVAAAACRKAKGLRGRPVTVVEVSPRYGEVTAKEQPADAPEDASYGDEWVSAVLIIVHPVPTRPGVSKVEWHHARRSPLMGCGVDWARSLPGWIDEALAERSRVQLAPGASSGS